MKKIISVVLSLAMFLSVFGSITVFAANTNDLDFDTDTYTYKMGSTNGYIGRRQHQRCYAKRNYRGYPTAKPLSLFFVLLSYLSFSLAFGASIFSLSFRR